MSYTVKFQSRESERLVVAGCGGTGGFVAEGLCRLFIDSDIPILLMDHDRVEAHNLSRQNFFAGEVGKFKSQVLAERLARKYGRKIGYSVYPFDRDMLNEQFGAGMTTVVQAFIIGCVDNPAARRSIAESMQHGDVWLDAGNSNNSGQVLIGNATSVEGLNGVFNEMSKEHTVSALPIPSLQLPSLLIPVDKPKKRLQDCAEAVEDNEQSPVINQAMATLVLEFVRRIKNRTLTWMGAYLDLEAGTLHTVPAEPETIARMFDVEVDTLMAQACSRGLLKRP